MRTLTLVWLVLAFACTLTSGAPAQDGYSRFMPDKLDRKTEKDEQGLLQWVKHEPGKCQACKGTGKTECKVCARFPDDITNCPDCKRKEGKEVTCRACLGTGSFPDPLEKVQCPACVGSAYLLCTICSGAGGLKVDKSKRLTPCPGCRGAGCYPCGVCKGERWVGVAKLKPSLAEADAKNLKKALKTTDGLLAAVTKFNPVGGDKVRKEVKAFSKMMKDAQKLYPPFKPAQKVLKDYMSKIYAGSNFMSAKDQQKFALSLMKSGSEYYLKHQKRMIELALARAEANEKTLAEQKGK